MPSLADKIVSRTNLGELKTTAPSCYLEAEFHTWMRGVTWLRSSESWVVRIAIAIDQYLGYPRSV